jgi:carbonic anhydrase/acetyltransferase-like protein (isoleucine patch superfamily)
VQGLTEAGFVTVVIHGSNIGKLAATDYAAFITAANDHGAYNLAVGDYAAAVTMIAVTNDNRVYNSATGDYAVTTAITGDT